MDRFYARPLNLFTEYNDSAEDDDETYNKECRSVVALGPPLSRVRVYVWGIQLWHRLRVANKLIVAFLTYIVYYSLILDFSVLDILCPPGFLRASIAH